MKKNIKAFAFWNVIQEKGYRTGTLLTGNGNETIVGNCVMKNPGSSKPTSNTIRDDGRHEFSIDPTMYAIAELFMIDKFGGTVRIFNLADEREADYSKATNILTPSQDDSYVDIGNSIGIPTYIGWGNIWKDSRFISRAKKIFELAKRYSPHLKPRIEDNLFYHPLYLMRYGKNKPDCIKLLSEFRSGNRKSLELSFS